MNKKTKLSIIIATILSLFGFSGYELALGNPTIFPIHSSCATASATTTLSWMTPGTATTTITCDSYSVDPNVKNPTAFDGVGLNLLTVASSTASVIGIKIEVSTDGIDYYGLSNTLATNATSTVLVGTFGENTVAFASSTLPNGSPYKVGVTDASLLHFDFPTINARYVKVSLYPKIGGLNAAVWAELVPRKQVR